MFHPRSSKILSRMFRTFLVVLASLNSATKFYFLSNFTAVVKMVIWGTNFTALTTRQLCLPVAGQGQGARRAGDWGRDTDRQSLTVCAPVRPLERGWTASWITAGDVPGVPGLLPFTHHVNSVRAQLENGSQRLAGPISAWRERQEGKLRSFPSRTANVQGLV